MQIEALLTEISAEAPCGEDLEYDPEFMALVQDAQGKPEQQFGDTIVPAVEPNWAEVSSRAEALFARTKDLRVTMLLARALLRQSGLTGLGEGLLLTQQLLERYWDGVYPRIEVEYDNDATMRLNALAALVDADGLLRDLRANPVIPPGPKGRVTVRDILVVTGKLPAAPDDTLTAGQIQSLIQDAAAQHGDAIAAVRACADTARDLQTLLNERLGVDRSIDLKPLRDMLDAAAKACESATGAAQGDAAPQDEVAAGGVAVSAGVAVGDIRSREDAIRALERVCEFIERAEPSNPAPLLIRRAQRLISKNFLEIIEDLAPGSLDTIKGIAGIQS